MKRFALLVFASVFVSNLLFAQIYLPVSAQGNGEIMVSNLSNLRVTDKFYVANRTANHIVLTVKGMHMKEGLVNIAQVSIMSGMEIALSTQYEDRLKMFSYFLISLSEGTITNCVAEVSHHDLHFAITQVAIGEKSEESTGKMSDSQVTPASSGGDVEEQLLKLKKYLDAGIITQEEFNAKRKELIGF